MYRYIVLQELIEFGLKCFIDMYSICAQLSAVICFGFRYVWCVVPSDSLINQSLISSARRLIKLLLLLLLSEVVAFHRPGHLVPELLRTFCTFSY